MKLSKAILALPLALLNFSAFARVNLDVDVSIPVQPAPQTVVYEQQPQETVVVEQAPPPVIVETVPAPQPGYIWIGGYWGWVGGRHYWYPGRWAAGRPGYAWVGPRWAPAGGGRYRFTRGYWRR